MFHLIIHLWLLTAVLIFPNISITSSTTDKCTATKYEQVPSAIRNCKNIVIDSVRVPGGARLLLDLTEGSAVTFRGNITFGYYEWKGPLVSVTGTNVSLRGEPDAVLDGQGSLYWDGLGTWGNVTKPRFFKITVKNSIMQNINILNCPVGCIEISDSNDVIIRHWKIDNSIGDEGVAPANKFAHNTDGFNIGRTDNVLIEHSIVYNQDDCVAIGSGANITVRQMFCHGSHGLTVSQGGETLRNASFSDSVVTNSENGIHIKTHVNGSKGLITNVTFSNITLLDCKYYGINIQQNYVNLPAGIPEDGPPENNIPIHNLTMTDISGNVENGAVPVYILCAEKGCFDWNWVDVRIEGNVKDNCTNFVPRGYNC